MALPLIALAGLAIGAAAMLLPGSGRDLYGVVALPLWSCAVGTAVWTLGVLLGAPGLNLWLWLGSLAASAGLAYAWVRLVPLRRRRTLDALHPTA